MDKKQAGFTLIELVMVIVILGILAAVAIPKFVDLSAEAEQAAVDGVAGSLASASAVNYATCSAKSHVITAGKCEQVNNCQDVSSLLNPGLPTGYSIGSVAIGTNGTAETCTVTKGSYSKTFSGIGAAI